MIIPLELELIVILALAGWFQNRCLFLLFAAGEVFVIAQLIIFIFTSLRAELNVREYSGSVRYTHMAAVRANVHVPAFCGRHITIRAVLTLPSGDKKKLKYKVNSTASLLSLPVPAISVGVMKFTVKRFSYSDAAGIFFFSKKINKTIEIPVTDRDVTEEKQSQFSGDEIRSFREYRHGDEKRDIHWNISARFGKYYVREYEGGEREEVTRATYESESLETPETDKLKKKTVKIRRKQKRSLFAILLRIVLTIGIVMTYLPQVQLLPVQYRMNTNEVMLTGVIGAVAVFIILGFRISSVMMLAAAAAIYVVRDMMNVADDNMISFTLIALLALFYMVVTRVRRTQKKAADISHVVNIVIASLSIVIGMTVALRGNFATKRMNAIYDTETAAIERAAQTFRMNYRVPFDGTVGQQLNQFTGETQLTVSVNNIPKNDVYLRFFSGRNYNGGRWTDGDPEALDNTCWEIVKKKTHLDNGDLYSMQGEPGYIDRISIFTALQYQTAQWIDLNGLSMHTYAIRNVKPKGISSQRLSYDLSQITMPVGFGTMAPTKDGSEAALIEVAPDISECTDDISTLKDMYENQLGPESYSDDDSNDYINSYRLSGASCHFIDAYYDNYSKYYLGVPDSGLRQTRQLVEDQPLTSPEEITAYIRYILASHASYSLKARDPIGNTDPVEYFLFSSHKGYCEQYASAACLLYRMYGIPARYASGYRVSPKEFQNRGTAMVPDSDAHAWVEIYQPSTGWIPVEMTPATLPEGADINETGYPVDDTVIWPGFSDRDVYNIQKEKGWTGRVFKRPETEDEEEAESTSSSSESKSTQEQQSASADATDNDQNTSESEKELPIVKFVKEHRTIFTWILIAIIALIVAYVLTKIAEYRFRHGGLKAIGTRTDRIMRRSRNFAIYVDHQTAEDLTWYFRILDRAEYTGYTGSADEVRRAYEIYDRLIVLVRK